MRPYFLLSVFNLVTFERLAKTFQFLKMINGSYSRSYFTLFLIYAVAPDTRKYIPVGWCFHCTWKINHFSKSFQLVNIENADFLKSEIWFSPFKTRLVQVLFLSCHAKLLYSIVWLGKKGCEGDLGFEKRESSFEDLVMTVNLRYRNYR